MCAVKTCRSPEPAGRSPGAVGRLPLSSPGCAGHANGSSLSCIFPAAAPSWSQPGEGCGGSGPLGALAWQLLLGTIQLEMWE